MPTRRLHGTVIAEMSTSLDGFVADLSGEVRPLFDWYENGEVETPTADHERWPSERRNPLRGIYAIRWTGWISSTAFGNRPDHARALP